jgi:hypothetical protein
MLSAADVEMYGRLVAGAEEWLRRRGIPCYSPDLLSSEVYADLSHPLADGYAMLAERLWALGLR